MADAKNGGQDAPKTTAETDYSYKPTFLPIESFFSDFDAYQREKRRRFVEQYATPERFKESRIGTLSVSERPDGRYAVVDGQQRWEILRKMGWTHVWANLYTGLTLQQEALLFVDLNFARTNVKSWDHYKAARTAEDPDVLGVDAVCASFGFVVTGDGSRADTLGCCKTLTDIYSAAPEIYRRVKEGEASQQLKGPDVLRECFVVIDRIWRRGLLPKEWSFARSSALLAGLGRFFFANPGVTGNQLAAALSGALPSSIVLQADGSGGGHGRGVDQILQKLWEDDQRRTSSAGARRRRGPKAPKNVAVAVAA